MMSRADAKAAGIIFIADLFGRDYVKRTFQKSCQAYPDDDETDFEYFVGFESENDRWSVYALVSVNRVTKEVSFLNYRLPNGETMPNPIKVSHSCM